MGCASPEIAREPMPLRALAITAAVAVALLGVASSAASERLKAPFASVIPACERTTYAPKLSYENQHEVKSGELVPQIGADDHRM